MSTAQADATTSYAAEVARLLWPTPWAAPYVTRGRPRSGVAHREAYLLPGGREPRMLVPVGLPGSAAMVQRLGAGQGLLAAPARHLLERSVRHRVLTLVGWPTLRVPAGPPGAESVEDHLAACLGREVRVGVLLGTRRVNQKPVLPVFDRDGVLRAYAKIGHNPLTAGLVRREAAALALVADHRPRSFRVPRVLHHGRWSDLEVLVVSPLATEPRRPVPPPARLAVERELVGLAGTRSAPLGATSFWRRLEGAAADLADRPHGARLAEAVHAVAASSLDRSVRLGGWHGDWGSWNTGMAGDVVQVWDWERYDAAVPAGFDALHFAAQAVRPGARAASQQEQTFLRSVPAALAALDVPPADHALTLRLYLLEIGVRYVDALTHGATPALLRRTAWVLSLLERLADVPATHHLHTGGRP